ncbi:hypothetical protein [Methylocella sp.]|uniref:hypothetical protein n=1 Tax=Methylocella sp. TaxID=1978226 RepID=UPI0037844F60
MTRDTKKRDRAPSAAALAASLALFAFAPGAAQAQTAPGAPGTPNALPQKQAIPEKVDEPLRSGRSESLSDRLDETNGVVKPPPGVDPGIVQPAPVPHPNSTPVIPPPPGPQAK